MKQTYAPLDEFVAAFVGSPVWGVRQGYASFLTLNFGEPILSVKERNSRELGFRRDVQVDGQWVIWIYCCEWRIISNSALIAHSESTREDIASALAMLNGQFAMQITVDPENGSSEFQFDLGAVLETEPSGDDSQDEQWFIYAPGNCFAYRADGCFRVGPPDQDRSQEQWQTFR